MKANKVVGAILFCTSIGAAPLLPAARAVGSTNPDLTVPHGQLTFDAEGTEGGPFHSRKLHWPGGASGLTIGRGYDMKGRSADEVADDLTKADVPEDAAKKLGRAAKVKPEDAEQFLRDNGDLPEITLEQQRRLFERTYARYEEQTKAVAADPKVVEAYGAVDWEKLNPAIKDLLIDLDYRGDYTRTARELIQKLVAKNDLPGVFEVVRDRGAWPNVPCDRFYRRVDYLRAAVNRPPGDAGGPGPMRIIYDETQPKGAMYRNAAGEKIGKAALQMERDGGYKPEGDRTRAADFVRDLGKQLRGADVAELQGSVKDQYDRLKASPVVEKLWLPERMSEDDRGRLREARDLLVQARDLAKGLAEARKQGDKDGAQKLAKDLAEVQKKVQQKTYCLQRALKEAQTRANEGDQVIAVWSAEGQPGAVAWVVPTRGADSDLKVSDDWGKLPLPHAALAAGKVYGYTPLDSGFGSVETIEGLSLFVLKPAKD